MSAPESCRIFATGANIFLTSGLALILTPNGVTSAGVCFHCCEMIRDLFLVILCVLLRSGLTILFIHPCDHADGALRFQMKFLDQICRFHRYCNPRAVVDRACAE